MPTTTRDNLAHELEDAGYAADHGWIEELNPMRLLKLSEELRRAGRADEAVRAEALAGRAVWAGACEA